MKLESFKNRAQDIHPLVSGSDGSHHRLWCFSVHDESVQMWKVHHSIALVYGNVFDVVLVTLVLGKIDKYLKKSKKV